MTRKNAYKNNVALAKILGYVLYNIGSRLPEDYKCGQYKWMCNYDCISCGNRIHNCSHVDVFLKNKNFYRKGGREVMHFKCPSQYGDPKSLYPKKVLRKGPNS